MELHAGFPYTIQHAAAVADLSLECLFPPVSKKGLITDLDETLWKGTGAADGIHEIEHGRKFLDEGHAGAWRVLGSAPIDHLHAADRIFALDTDRPIPACATSRPSLSRT
jgi:hypothetical protein